MAEAAISFMVEKIGKLLIEEADFLDGVYDKVEGLKVELGFMQSFLKDADEKQEQNHLVKTWVMNIRSTAYDTEDIIDNFVFEVAAFQRQHGFKGFIKRYVCIFNKCKLLHKFGIEIAAIQGRISQISTKGSDYGIRQIAATGEGEEGTSLSTERLQQQLRRSSPYATDDEFVIGQTRDVDKLIKELLKEDERRRVLSIFGIGGLGKTTLARKIYNHNEIKGHVSCYAWVTVSKKYSTTDILQSIIKNVSNPRKEELEVIEKMTTDELEVKVRRHLGGRRYLVVLDDIWSRDAWGSLKNALPNTRNKSRVIITTRNRKVIPYPDVQTYLHELQCLTNDESWELFCRKAFPENNTPSCPVVLEKIGKLMVEKCGGLPLVLIVLARLLSKNKSIKEWEAVFDNINWYLTNGQCEEGSIISGILGLSYNDLPYYLKSCFLHLGIFPEDYKINATKLIGYWTVEGILPQQGHKATEKVAEECLNELIDRSLLQVVERTKGSGRVKSCRIHDLLRDLSVSEAKEQNLLLEITSENLHCEDLSKPYRRCGVHSYEAAVTSLQQQSAMRLRTLIFFEDYFYYVRQIEFLCKCSKFLRTLDLGKIRIKFLPRAIGNLIHLRYLSFDVTDLENEIPTSVGNLRNLQYLRIENRSIKSLKIPNIIWKMERLRHLFIGWSLDSSHIRMDTLKELRFLRYLRADSWIRGGKDAGNNLTNLVQLGIIGIPSSHMEVLLHSFRRLKCLHSLTLEWTDDDVTGATLAPLAVCSRLFKLGLEGRLEKLTDPCVFPPNLTTLTLNGSDLKQDSMVTLASLPNLRNLRLHPRSYIWKKLVFVAEGFRVLHSLVLERLIELEEWIVEEGALVMLRHLRIIGCSKLKMIPEGLKGIKEMHISFMPGAFMMPTSVFTLKIVCLSTVYGTNF